MSSEAFRKKGFVVCRVTQEQLSLSFRSRSVSKKHVKLCPRSSKQHAPAFYVGDTGGSLSLFPCQRQTEENRNRV